jgi:hypothetical protein
MGHRLVLVAAIVASGACGACGPETTSFRTTDRSASDRIGPPSAGYDVYVAGQLVARAHVWSSGGFISSSDQPITHIGFEISNTSARPVLFDGDALELRAFDGDSAALPAPRLTSLSPAGLPLVTIPPSETVVLAAYFHLPVRPRGIDSLEARWTLRTGNDEYRQITGFIRDDDAPIVERMPTQDLRSVRP